MAVEIPRYTYTRNICIKWVFWDFLILKCLSFFFYNLYNLTNENCKQKFLEKTILLIHILVLGMGRSAMSILADLWLVLRQPFFPFFFWLLCWTSCVIKVLSGMVFPFKKGYRILSAPTEQLYSSLVVWLHFWNTWKHRHLI